ncbi:MAG: DUF2807 domain-containing protein, partial [Bacteroidota bacterium]|nr:DUF2807 domain-containing protein [Bacteroidota bacterium]
MKKLILAVLFVAAGATYAQDDTKDVGDFTEVKVFDRMRVNLIKDSENKVYLKGKDTDYIELINKDGVLKIRMDLDKI